MNLSATREIYAVFITRAYFFFLSLILSQIVLFSLFHALIYTENSTIVCII